MHWMSRAHPDGRQLAAAYTIHGFVMAHTCSPGNASASQARGRAVARDETQVSSRLKSGPLPPVEKWATCAAMASGSAG
jgi:hypothetical protein